MTASPRSWLHGDGPRPSVIVHEQRTERRVWLGHVWMAPTYRADLKAIPESSEGQCLDRTAHTASKGGYSDVTAPRKPGRDSLTGRAAQSTVTPTGAAARLGNCNNGPRATNDRGE